MSGIRSRLGWLVGAIAILMVASPACAFQNVHSPTSSPGYSNVYAFDVGSLLDVMAPFADAVSIPAAIPGSEQRPAFLPAPIKQRASRSAVRPTAIAGWRSGRTRFLASA